MCTFDSVVDWIHYECGGRQSPAVIGLRPTIRFQKFIRESLEGGWDVEILDLEHKVDENVSSGQAVRLRLNKRESPYVRFLEEGQLFELLDGYRVIGVGKITSIENV